jgi:hypothetical protein
MADQPEITDRVLSAFLRRIQNELPRVILPLTSTSTFPVSLEADLKQQALDTTLGHAQAAMSPSDAQLNEIVSFELGLITAQRMGRGAGLLDKHRASGGSVGLANQAYLSRHQ